MSGATRVVLILAAALQAALFWVARSADMREAAQAQVVAQANAQTVAELQRRAALAATLQQGLADAQAAITQITQERNDAIAHTTTGRACFDSGTLRVLNGAAGLRVAAAQSPGTTAGTDAAHAAPATPASEPGRQPAAVADGLVATDTDVGHWMLAAGAQYEQCRVRLDALIDYVADPTAQQHKATQ
jgi:hypothetical protein